MSRRHRRTVRTTPLRGAILDDSALQSAVDDGLGAIKRAHRRLIHDDLRSEFADSLDADAAFVVSNPTDNRWDYLLGHVVSGMVIGLEPHSAREDEVSTVIAKQQYAMVQLRPHLRPGAFVERWLWVASGDVNFADTEKARRRLDQNGIKFVGRRLLGKHLPPAR